MTPRAILLTLSLLGNAALVAAYFVGPAGSPRTPRDSAPGQAGQAGVVDPAGKAGTAKTPAPLPAKPLPSWASLDTPDLDEFSRRLKAAGFSPAEIRLILSRRISQMFNPNPAGAAAKTTPYWQPPFRPSQASEEQRKQVAEQQRLFRKYVTGPGDLANDPEELTAMKRRWGDLPAEKLQAIAKIESDYEELQLQQYAERRNRPGEPNTADAARLIQQERVADIARILTPEEYAAWEIRASPAATSLRFRLEAFKPTEDEYKAIFAITKVYQDQWNNPQLGADALKAANAAITAKVAEVLGPDRALDYDAAMNQNSQDQTAGLVSRLGLPARVASEVRQTQQDFTQRGKDIRANASLSSGERDAQLTALARQAEAQLTAKLGANGFEAYNDLKGEWIRALQPKAGGGRP